MRVSDLASSLLSLPGLSELGAEGFGHERWEALAPEARPLLVAALYRRAPLKAVIVTSGHERALQWQTRLELGGIPREAIRQLPSGLSALFEDAAPETFALSDRIAALRFLIGTEPGIVIATPQSALERTLPRDVLEKAFRGVRPGELLDPEDLLATLALLGYEPADPVRMPGQFCRRGGIVDVFAAGGDLPVRIEWFGDQVESLRAFDPNTQRSVATVDGLDLAPSRETLIETGHESFRTLLETTLAREEAELDHDAAVRLRELVEDDIRALTAGVYFDRLDLYRPILHPDSGCALDLDPDALVILDEPLEIDRIATLAAEELGQSLHARAGRGEILAFSAHDYVLPPDHIGHRSSSLSLSGLGAYPDWLPAGRCVAVNAFGLESVRGRGDALARLFREGREKGETVVLCTDQPTRAGAALAQLQVFPAEGEPFAEEGRRPGLFVVRGNLAGGFCLPEAGVTVVTDLELFGVGRLRLPQRRFAEGVPIATVLDLKPGDYVVHIHFGIGIFRGLVKRTIDGVEKEYLHIDYAPPDKLFVPADQLDRVQKYLNPGDAEPKINRLSGTEWQRTVGKAREDAREFARDLIRLYARRREVKRAGLGPDSPWQSEMEATFPWVETPAQLAAIRETKRDLEGDYPMDRLVCGDVGFGKTEVAIRAAFKVAQAGKQVAVLCPTTILSEQHYRTFRERLAPWPVRIELLNRFRTSRDRQKIKHAIEQGEVDIVIGTHALLHSELEFKDLGLVVIDEEQKFGVKQKEALKQLRVSVDVLTLSATPIPRTLSMALMDIRQMSLINEPPPGRLPVRTFVRSYSDEVVKEAILRELARGGQVYYVYNRVQGIYHVAERLRRLVPSARIAVGHGQMTEKDLEGVMLAFIAGEVDVLVSTTIIENGLDIPNANTLIVENADRFGLAQLYQLRGRVGRSDRQAYAYLLFASSRQLTEGALQRLQSLQEFSALGSGYSLAFRDLQIRGAGELLGAKQHGAMAAVGYELFTQLISEEVKFLKAHADGEAHTASYRDPLEGLEPLPTLDLPVPASIPESYIEDQGQRLYAYKRLMSCRTLEELAEVEDEIRDRYGALPPEVANALAVMRLRIEAGALSIDRVDGSGGRLAVTFREGAELSPRLFSILGQKNRSAYFTRGTYVWPFTGSPLRAAEACFRALREALDTLAAERAALPR